MVLERREPNPEGSIAIIAITRHGVSLAMRLQAKLAGSVCHVPLRHRFALAMGARGFHRVADLLPELWSRYRALVFVMATGIVVRHIAPFLRDKTVDPAVVVLDERGCFAVSLLSGHLGGANALAKRIAEITGGQAVITTASDVQRKPALDLIAQEAGLEIENMEMAARLTRAFLEDEPVWIYDPENRLKSFLTDEWGVLWLKTVPALPLLQPFQGDGPCSHVEQGECGKTAAGVKTPGKRVVWREPCKANENEEEPDERSASVGIWVSELRTPRGVPCLILRPRNLVVGVGCNRGTPAHEILDLLENVFRHEGLSPVSIRNLATIDAKSDEPGILEASSMLKRPVTFYSRGEIQRVTVPNPSAMVTKHMGVSSVCEATALLDAQSKELIVPKRKTANVTLAVAKVSSPS